ncbi:MAG TPA: flagellar type III secretion system pore protein FliP [Fimbriimonadaceae bacterium]|nr:flagellar type III secretion system pore protein FliP [Fimbriimonadaceae bacterium]HRJ32007.1 flagellar type III secretion system pore protein FliP [Fimbriimonadaceae bacterium]
MMKSLLHSVRKVFSLRALTVISLVLMGCMLYAQSQVTVPSVNIGLGPGTKNPNDVSTSLQILALLTVLSVAPAILILTTAFTRIVIIFSFVRSALGTQSIPPNQVISGLSLFLTFFVMAPTYEQVHQNAIKPYMAKEITLEQAMDRAQKPVREFMLKNTYEKDLMMFLDMRNEKPKTRDEVSLVSLIPAFVLSELKTAFIIGFYIFIPFVMIDLIVASALMSMGMMMMPPIVVSLPAKLLVFILADGWSVLVGAVLSGYR